MPAMPPEAMPPEQGAPAEGGGQDVIELAKSVGEGLVKLSDLMGSSGAVEEQDIAQMSQILSMYSDLVEKKLGGSPEAQGPVPAEPGVVSAQGGPNGVPAGPQSRM